MMDFDHMEEMEQDFPDEETLEKQMMEEMDLFCKVCHFTYSITNFEKLKEVTRHY